MTHMPSLDYMHVPHVDPHSSMKAVRRTPMQEPQHDDFAAHIESDAGKAGLPDAAQPDAHGKPASPLHHVAEVVTSKADAAVTAKAPALGGAKSTASAGMAKPEVSRTRLAVGKAKPEVGKMRLAVGKAKLQVGMTMVTAEPLVNVPQAVARYEATGSVPSTMQASSLPLADTPDHGPTSARVFAEHWYGNGYLSFVEAGLDTSTALTPPAGGGAGTDIGACIEPSGSVPMTMEPMAAIPGGFDAKAPSPPGIAPATWSALTEESMEGAMSPVASMRSDDALLLARYPGALLWQSRSAEGLVTLWIRDFSIPEGERRALSTHARNVARHAGVKVARVMVNGREAWVASTHNTSSREP